MVILDESHGFESEASADELRRAGAIIVGINGTPTSGSLLSVVRFLGALGDDVAHRVDAVRVAVQRRVLRREIPPATWTVVAQTRYVQTTPSQLAAAKGTLARWVGSGLAGLQWAMSPLQRTCLHVSLGESDGRIPRSLRLCKEIKLAATPLLQSHVGRLLNERWLCREQGDSQSASTTLQSTGQLLVTAYLEPMHAGHSSRGEPIACCGIQHANATGTPTGRSSTCSPRMWRQSQLAGWLWWPYSWHQCTSSGNGCSLLSTSPIALPGSWLGCNTSTSTTRSQRRRSAGLLTKAARMALGQVRHHTLPFRKAANALAPNSTEKALDVHRPFVLGG